MCKGCNIGARNKLYIINHLIKLLILIQYSFIWNSIVLSFSGTLAKRKCLLFVSITDTRVTSRTCLYTIEILTY